MTEDVEQPAEAAAAEPEPERIPFAEFLESYPTHTVQHVTGYHDQDGNSHRRQAPVLRLHCPKCGGVRNFAGDWVHDRWLSDTKTTRDFLKYTCRDCHEGEKTFCLISQATDGDGNGCAIKIGEIPELHIDLPRSVKPLLGDDYDLFAKGLTCEKRGLGIGAFTYYRRVVEGQKSHLVSEILRVAAKLGAPEDVQRTLQQAATEKQFSRTVDMIKDAIPQAVLVDGHNPVKLLHDALSVGVHAETDDACLRVAHSIRLVLADLAERLKLALQDQAELRSAIGGLLKFSAKAKKEAKGKPTTT